MLATIHLRENEVSCFQMDEFIIAGGLLWIRRHKQGWYTPDSYRLGLKFGGPQAIAVLHGIVLNKSVCSFLFTQDRILAVQNYCG